MKTRILTPLAAVLAMLATACQDPPPEPATVTEPEPAEPELAAYLDVDFMGTREERERRAPYSPIWWPHEVGEVVSHQHWWQLYHTNPWNGIGSVFWLDTLAFEPVFSTVWPEGEPVPTGNTYEGHFPRKAIFAPDEWWHDWPEHLAGQDSADVERWLYDAEQPKGIRGATNDEKAMWTRERWLDGWKGPGTGGNE